MNEAKAARYQRLRRRADVVSGAAGIVVLASAGLTPPGVWLARWAGDVVGTWSPLAEVIVFVAVLAAAPGLCARLAGFHFDPPMTALLAGSSIMGASFLLLWACDAAQAEISQALALAAVGESSESVVFLLYFSYGN